MKQRKKYFLLVLCTMILGIFMSGAAYANTQPEIGTPRMLQLYNPQVDTVLLKWNQVKDAEQYYVYMSKQEEDGYQMVCGLSENHLLLKGLEDDTVFYFKVYAYGNGTVSQASEVVSGKANIKGIDVSKHNGEIDWKTVKKSGQVDFAIIRCGYGDNMEEQDDHMFEENVKACEKWDIPMGVYLYSYADSTAHAQSEADHVLRMIKGKKFPYKVWYDLEDAPTVGTQSAKVIGDMAEIFCNSITKAGFEVGIYANKYWFTNILTDKRFDKWPKWVAQYNDECTYSDVYIMWQYTSDGSIPGIEGRVDLNYAFTGVYANLKNVPVYDVSKGLTGKILKPEGILALIKDKNTALIQWNEAVGSSYYVVYRSEEPTSGFRRIGTTETTEFEDTTIGSGNIYYYKVRGVNSLSTSNYSEVSKLRVMTNTPTKVTAEARSYNRIKIDWKSYSDEMGVEVYRSLNKDTGYKRIGTTTEGFYVDKNIQADVRYYYYVRAFRIANENGMRIYSNRSQIVHTVAKLNPVAEVSIADNGYDTLRLKYSAVQGATGYEIYRGIRKNGSFRKIATTPKLFYYDRNLTTGVTYFYKVRAIREENGIVVSSADTKPVWKNPKLGKTYGIRASSEKKGQVDVEWVAVDGASGYIVYRCSKKNGSYTKAGQTKEQFFDDMNRKSGNSYYYKVRAYRYVNGKIKYGDWSGIKKVTVQ